MGRRILLTGASGFIGSYVLALLRDWDPGGANTWLASRFESGGGDERHVNIDLTDNEACRRLVERIAPHVIMHLAGAAAVGGTEGVEAEVWKNNFLATFNLASAVLSRPDPIRFVFASSAEVYGRAFLDAAAVRETVAPDPLTTYGRTKFAAEMMLRDVLSACHQVVVLRLFNSFGPGQTHRFVTGAFASQIATMERGAGDRVMRVGNLEALRDFVDVRDTSEAIFRTATADLGSDTGSFVFNVSSGQPHRIGDILATLQWLSRVPFEIEVDPARLRPSDIPCATGDSTAIRQLTGWAPKISWEQTLGDTLAWWRKEIARKT